MRCKYSLSMGTGLALLLGLILRPSAQDAPIRVFRTAQAFHAEVGQAVTLIDFSGLPIGSLGGDTYRERGVIISTSQPLQAHRKVLAPSLSVEPYIGDSGTKILVSDAIPVDPHALTVQFPSGTLAAGCFVIAAAGEEGTTLQVEARAADGSQRRVEVTAFAERQSGDRRNPRRRDQPETTFIGFASPAGITSLAFSTAGESRGTLHNFGIDDITFVSK